MKTADIMELNRDFALQQDGHRLHFSLGQGDIPVIEIQNAQASARISLQGAHLLSWIPADEEDVIWLSTDAKYAPGKSVRGGIPICWPWFGPHESHAAYPAHGFARTVMWQVTNTLALASGETQLTFQLDTRQLDADLQPMWPASTVAEYRLTIGRTLGLELSTFNHSDQAITIGQALHTYFQVGDVRKTKVYGLEDKEYLDKTDGFKRKKQSGAVIIDAEVDRVYLQIPDEVIIDDTSRKIRIKKQGSQSTVVWNPWQVVAEKMGDLGKDGYRKMLCVESANAAEDIVCIQAGDSHCLGVTYGIEH